MVEDSGQNQKRVPENFSLLGLYGRREIFRRLLFEGYMQVSHGTGQWVGDLRIVALWAFYHMTDPLISTYEHPKYYTDLGTMHGSPFEKRYTSEEFEAYCKDNKIKLESRRSVEDIINHWELKSP